jgi:hypothetical protein
MGRVDRPREDLVMGEDRMRRIERTVVPGWLLLSVLMALPAFGSTLTVTNTNDSGPGSLRDAILLASPGDTIDFSVTGTITLDSTLTIDKSVTISGPGASSLSISGNNSVVVLATNISTNVTISGLTITQGFNAAPGGWGGGIVNKGTLTLSNCVIAANVAAAGAGPGGGIFNYSSLTLINSTVSGNSAAYGGGGIWNNGNAALTVTDSIVSGNSSTGDGGGISNVNGTMTITRTRISDNSSPGSGGGLSNYGTLTLVDSTVSGNSNNGIFNWGGSTLTITGSTISGNTSVGWGGGINSWGTVTIANSTFASNTAVNGGGIFNYAGTMAVSHSTFSGNSAGIASGGGIWNQSQLTLKNAILANSPSGGNCGGSAGTSAGYNLSDDNSCSSFFVLAGDLNSLPAGLDPSGLQTNGGATKTIALLPSSLGLNAIPVGNCTDVSAVAVTIDQRGVSRPQGAACDMGSFEAAEAADITPPVVSGVTTPSPNGAGWNNTNVLVTLTAADAESGVDVVQCVLTGAQAETVTGTPGETSLLVPVLAEGVTAGSCVATDRAGNASEPGAFTVRIDRTPPTIAILSPAATTYDLSQTVLASFNCFDTPSGFSSCQSTVPINMPINTSTAGTHTFTVSLADLAGNSATQQVTYTVRQANEAGTPSGSGVSVAPTATLPDGSTAPVSMSFDSVVSGGTTTVETSSTGPPPPDGFKLGQPPIYYDLETTAVFSGSVRLCFTWQEGQVANETHARLFHFAGGAWIDVTTSVDTQANVICGTVTSLSPFAIAEVAYTFNGFEPPLLADGSASIQQNNAGRTIPVKFTLTWHGQPVTDATATIAVYKVLDSATGTVDTTSLTEDAGAANDNDNQFRHAGNGRYIFNLSTTGWPDQATYRLVVTLSDGGAYWVDFSLR